MDSNRRLGCVLAGGQSKRFGSDKAEATLEGERLLDRAINALSGWCSKVVVAGREEPRLEWVADWPRSGMGPLAGIAAALRHAAANNFAEVLTIGVDSIGLPSDLPAELGQGPVCVSGQPVIGLWPLSALGTLERLLARDDRHSLLHFADLCGARLVDLSCTPANVNSRADLDRLREAR